MKKILDNINAKCYIVGVLGERTPTIEYGLSQPAVIRVLLGGVGLCACPAGCSLAENHVFSGLFLFPERRQP